MNDPRDIAARLLEDDNFDPKEYVMSMPAPKYYLLMWPGGFGEDDSYYCLGDSSSHVAHWRHDITVATRFPTIKTARKPYPDLVAIGTKGVEHLKIVPVYE